MERLLESAAGRPFSIGEISGMKRVAAVFLMAAACRAGPAPLRLGTTYTVQQDRKSTRLNSSHGYISYAVFCLKKKTCFKSGQRSIRTAEPQNCHSERSRGIS